MTLVHIGSPRTAIQLGIGMVQQHFTLIPALTVLENIVLAKEPRRFKTLLDTRTGTSYHYSDSPINLVSISISTQR